MFTFFKYQLEFLPLVAYFIAYVMALCVAMSFHEFAHAFIATTQGDYTPKVLGRCTLAPHVHFDILGFISLMLLGFGWAKPVPVDPRNFKKGKKSNFLVEIAGITTNIILGSVFLFIMMLISKFAPNFFVSSLYGTMVYMFLNLSVSLNFSLAFFNLLPIYPLDGFKIVENFSKYDNKFVAFMKAYSNIIYIAIIVLGIFEYYFYYTAGQVINLLIKLFSLILGV